MRTIDPPGLLLPVPLDGWVLHLLMFQYEEYPKQCQAALDRLDDAHMRALEETINETVLGQTPEAVGTPDWAVALAAAGALVLGALAGYGMAKAID